MNRSTTIVFSFCFSLLAIVLFSLLGTYQVRAQSTPDQQWEYKVYDRTVPMSSSDLARGAIDERGQTSWELVSVVFDPTYNGRFYMVFKRPKR